MPRSATARRFHQRRHGPLAGLEFNVGEGMPPQRTLEEIMRAPLEGVSFAEVPTELLPAVDQVVAWMLSLSDEPKHTGPLTVAVMQPLDDGMKLLYLALLDENGEIVGTMFLNPEADLRSGVGPSTPVPLRPKRRRSGWR